MSFTNSQVDPNTLPSIDDLEFTGLERSYLTAELLGLTLFWLFPSLGVVLFTIFNENDWPSWLRALPFILVLVLILTSFIWTIRAFKKKEFALRERDIVYKSGLVWRRVTVLPFNRIQHAEVEQGPIQRIFDLSELKVYTAGGSSSDLSISGISHDVAQRMKEFILRKTSMDEQE